MMTHRRWPAAAALILLAQPAEATLSMPECRALTAWVEGANWSVAWSPNMIGSRVRLAAPFFTADAERLFGKPMLNWTAEEAAGLDRHLHHCVVEMASVGRMDVISLFVNVRNPLFFYVRDYLLARAQARQNARQAAEAISAASPSLPLLAFVHALLAASASPDTYGTAARLAQQVEQPAGGHARDLVAALRDLPTVEIDAITSPFTARIERLRAEVIRALAQEIASAPISLDGLAALSRLAEAVGEHRAAIGEGAFASTERAIAERHQAAADEVAREIAAVPTTNEGMSALTEISGAVRSRYRELGPAHVEALERAIEAQREVIRTANLDAVLADIGRAPLDESGFEVLTRIWSQSRAVPLSWAGRQRVVSAAEARRGAIADALAARLESQLAALPASEEALDVIDYQMPSAIQVWGVSPGALQRFNHAAAARRAQIVAQLNRADSGSVRGRIYERQGMTLEFVDRTRVFVKEGPWTLAGTYTEESGGRIVVTVDGRSVVLTREGNRLVGGPGKLTRTK